MGSTYSGILGFLAFFTVVMKAMAQGGSREAALLDAAIYLAIFAGIGYVAGRVAQTIVEDSVRAKIAAEFKDGSV